MVKVYLLHLLHFYLEAYCTLVMLNYYVTGGVLISFLISRFTGISTALPCFYILLLCVWFSALLYVVSANVFVFIVHVSPFPTN